MKRPTIDDSPTTQRDRINRIFHYAEELEIYSSYLESEILNAVEKVKENTKLIKTLQKHIKIQNA